MSPVHKAANVPDNDPLSVAATFDLINLLWRRRRVIFASLVGVGLVGAMYYLFVPREYQAGADVLLVPKHPEVVTGDPQYVSGFNEFVATHRALIISPMIVVPSRCPSCTVSRLSPSTLRTGT